MKKYEFVTVKVKNNPVMNAIFSEHRRVIEEYIARGYEYKGSIPTVQGPSGKIIEMDLIFETEVLA